MKFLEEFFRNFSNLIWGNWLIITLISIGIYYTIMTGFIQIRKIPFIFRETIVKSFIKKNKKKLTGEGTLTPFQALCAALASCVGNGNIVGVATALVSGGPGAVFWMWIAGILGMATKFGEIVIGMIYREKSEDGTYVGGPMYYISKGLKMPWLANLYAALMVLQICGGNLIQSNAVAGVVENIIGIPSAITAIILVFSVGLVVIGGIKRLGSFAERVVPFMAGIYIICGIIVIIFNIKTIPIVFATIFKSAFNIKAGVAGVVGYSIRQSMRYGVARGLYSNEAGEGSAPVLHASAITDHPVRQGLYGITEVLIDTIVVCTITGLSILSTGVIESGHQASILTSVAFGQTHPIFKDIVGICMILFAYSTIPVQCYFGTVGVNYLLGSKKAYYFRYPFIFFTALGCISSLSLVWHIQDCILGLLIIPNLVAIVYLSPQVFKLTREFFNPVNEYIFDDNEE
ncbi:alanine/glycine:cation symporter family protein [Clostridium tetani]|uniref:Sodium:alanine symporter family protein n=1 Tax=Clostridium tetani TaxID=1513 RepID=A0ABY0EQE1_CLOTA|nr:sodium:alanine symporter family protein [Clostridium tetani]KHO39455.1 alanine glycine permease [Clostridium tetani]RXI53089.1 sodium:alanine symporter family protein [Clostridium tetani]RXI67362.1 sodium:alanine symporter family protein [Clostridium tetani]CDI49255.1 Na(+)-linked D-alanine glycine permease [Clostridium tetani 12124569]